MSQDLVAAATPTPAPGTAPDARRAPRAAILQSAYIPWKGYFDIIGSVDEFILYDDAHFDKGGFRNRNRIHTRAGPLWLTIPVQRRYWRTPIFGVEVCGSRWAAKHWRSLATHYGRAPHFGRLAPELEALYARASRLRRLSEINELFLRAVCGWLGLQTRISRSSDYRLEGDRVERLVRLCEQAGAAEYLTGPSARTYLDEACFARRGIAVGYMHYRGYPEYRQLHAPFLHQVSILDPLLNVGPEATRRHLIGALAPAAHEDPPAPARC